MPPETTPSTTLPFVSATSTTYIKFVISTLLMCLVFYFVPMGKIWDGAMTANGYWLLIAIALQILLRCVTALRMRVIAHAQNLYLNISTMLKIVFSSTFYNLLSPGALVGGIATYIKYLQHGAKPVSAIANLYANKLIETFVIALSAPLFWLLDKEFSIVWIFVYLSTMVVGIFLIWTVFLGRYGCMQWLVTLIGRLGQSIAHQKLAEFFVQITRIGQASYGTLFSVIAYSLLNFIIAAISVLSFAKALDIEIGILPTLWIYAVIHLLHILPISISNIGIREVSMIVLFAPYGVDATMATTWSLLMYSGLLSCGLIGMFVEAEPMWRHKKLWSSSNIKSE